MKQPLNENEPLDVDTGFLWKLSKARLPVPTGMAKNFMTTFMQHLYPGISFAVSGPNFDLRELIRAHVSIDILEMHPELNAYSSEATAKIALGDTLPVRTVRRCGGLQWKNEGAKWREQSHRPDAQTGSEAKPNILKPD